MTFKKAEMAKTLRNGLSMIEMNPLNHNWLYFAIQSGLTLHQFQKKTAVKCILYQNLFFSDQAFSITKCLFNLEDENLKY